MNESPKLGDPSTREAILAIVPKVTGGVSFVSSAWIAYDVLSNPDRWTKTYHRLLAIMSLCDMVGSFSFFLSTWPVPPGPDLSWGKTARLWAHGNDATCAAQAVGIQWTLTSHVLNVALAAHYLLVVRYNYSERALKKLEPLAWGLALLVGFAATIPGIFLGIYGNTNLWCWIAPDFARCSGAGMSEQECIDRAFKYRWAFYYGPLWTCIGLVTLLQIALFVTVWKVEGRSTRWRATGRDRRSQSAQVASQACWYVGAFYVAWLPYTSLTLTGRWFTSDDGFGALLLVVLLTPIQGFLNSFVYRRKQIVRTAASTWGSTRRSIGEVRRSITNQLGSLLATPAPENDPLVPEGSERGDEEAHQTESRGSHLEEVYAD